MSQWLLKTNGEIVLRRSLRPLQVSGMHSFRELNKREIFDDLVKKRWGSSAKPPENVEVKNDEQD